MSKSPSLRRIQADVRELALDPSDRYHASPLENDMFEWHFTIRGAEDTDFEGGIYHGRILLPPEYPFKPPHIVFLTPSGRFETNTKVCLSFSAFHPELWQPAWGIRLILEALIAFLPSPADGAIGALDWTSDERKRLALKSQSYCCPKCGKAADLLPKIEYHDDDDKNMNAPSAKKSKSKSRFEKEIELLRLAQATNEKNNRKMVEDSTTGTTTNAAAATTTTASTHSGANMNNQEDEVTDETEEHPPELTNEHQVAPPTPASTPPEPQDTTTPEHVVPQNTENPHEEDISWLTDPMLNFAMVLLSIICFLLGRKAFDLLEELNSLGVHL